MDILAHGLWSGAIYRKKRVWWAVLFGIAPDLFSFGIVFATHVLQNGFVRPQFVEGELPRADLVPAYAHALYNITHSLVVWLAVFIIIWILARKIPWEFSAWALHIIIDIPTHGVQFFPTPFLWPLPQPFFVNGISWGTPWFTALNYGTLFVVYTSFIIAARMRRRS